MQNEVELNLPKTILNKNDLGHATASPLKNYKKDGFSFWVARAHCRRNMSLDDVFLLIHAVRYLCLHLQEGQIIAQVLICPSGPNSSF